MSHDEGEKIQVFQTGITPPVDRTPRGDFDKSNHEPLIWLTSNELGTLKGDEHPTKMGYYKVVVILPRAVRVPGLELVVTECIKSLDEGITEIGLMIQLTPPGIKRDKLEKDKLLWETLKLEGREVGLWKRGIMIQGGTLEFGGGPGDLYVGGWNFEIGWKDFLSRKFEIKELGVEEFVEISVHK